MQISAARDRMPALNSPVLGERHRMLSPLNASIDSGIAGAAAANSPRGDNALSGPKVSDYLGQAHSALQSENHSRRNEKLSRSMAISSRTSNHSVAFEVLGSRVGGTAAHQRGGSAIDIREIIDSSQRCAQKIGGVYIPSLQKPMTYTFQKNKGKDFVSSI